MSYTRFQLFNTISSSLVHFRYTIHLGKYSVAQLFKIVWLYASDIVYDILQSTYLTESGIIGSTTTDHPKRKWFEVNASRSSNHHSYPTLVWHSKFIQTNKSWLSTLATSDVGQFPKIAKIGFLQLRASQSQISPKCGATGGFKFCIIRTRADRTHVVSQSQPMKHSLISHAPPTKFVSFSLMIVCGLPRLAMNLAIAFTDESLCSPFSTSMWTVPVIKHVIDNTSASLLYS